MTSSSNDATVAAGRLRCFMDVQALQSMTQAGKNPLQAVRDAGYDGVQLVRPLDRVLRNEALAMGLAVCGSGRVNTPDEAKLLAKEAREDGLECLTLHVGWGTESDDQAAALIGAVLDASAKYSVPLYFETHRSTIFQDPWRALHLLARFPELEFNGDFSHWYTGTEMVYGGFESKLEFIRPILDRIAFIHGRIGNPGCMQVDIGDGNAEERPYVRHFRALWTESFRGFLRRKSSADSFCFTPELLGPEIYYARVFDGREESDRWQQSLVLVRIARECFEEAARSCRGQNSGWDQLSCNE
jgi:sugar phosphate isomerase/epimerase